MKNRKRNSCWQKSLAAMVIVLLAVLLPVVATGALTKAGPVNPDNGFPLWYQDSNGLTLEVCLDPGLCLFDPVDPVNAFSVQIGFGGEAFWWSGESSFDFPNGDKALLVMALEAAFGAGDPAAGDQISFARIRIRIDVTTPGTYVVTYPFGQRSFDVGAAEVGVRAINMTSDVGIGLGGEFSGALTVEVGPFLQWDPNVGLPPAGFVGDGATPHRVVGSPIVNAGHSSGFQNFFRIDGPAGSNIGGPGVDFVETDLFVIQGKLATRVGHYVDRVTGPRFDNGNGRLNVWASSFPGQTLQVTGVSGIGPRTMVEDPGHPGKYFARIPFNTAFPRFTRGSVLTVSNVSDTPPFVVAGLPATDKVTITDNRYVVDNVANAGAGTLTVEAISNDKETGFQPTLTVTDQDENPIGVMTLAAGKYSLGPVVLSSPPSSITVTSSAGGSATESSKISRYSPRVP